ncbi:DENN domain-containing protein 1A-like isoform X3 [Mytilus californianus]|uniref:DENN domain-containing protein 1A-like isoform X3 n=1 Tax=Mytilus californianus TaxID=6549 RepID=UPI0022467CB1|nr:DENN domain-containing protein 1A-like isoform X3 [Mytilus californianus]
MGSRIRENPEKLFEVFLEIAKPENDDETIFVQKYPRDYNDEQTLKPIPMFAFPCDSERYTTKVDHFTFVLTDLESKYKFGYCRQAQGVQTCLCIVSCLPWFDVFYTILNKLAEMINTTDNDDNVTELLRATYANGVPTPGVPVQIIVGQDMLNFTAPDISKLPSIPTNRNLTEYYSAVDTENMMKIFASMLHERRILITSKKLSRLTSCVHASTALLYPMHWQHLFIPILPPHLLDYVTAPMPYVIGIHSAVLEKARKNEISDAVILDVDTNTLTTEYDDFEDLPSEISSYLKRHLKKDKIIQQMSTNGDVISKAFMQALVRLIGGYRDALRFHPGEPITFDPEAFVQSRPSSMQPFLDSMFELQIFQQFINDRLDMLNLGKGFSDLFEVEAMLQADKLNSQSRYKEWLGNMKKQGKQMQKNSKEYFKDFKDKAAPVVSNAMHTVRREGKKLYSGVRKQVQDIRKEDDHSRTKSMKQPRPDSKALSRNRPATVIHAAEIIPIRPLRPGNPPMIQVTGTDSRVSKYKLIHLADEKSIDDSEADLSYNRISVNLLSDPDIQVALNKSASVEDLGNSPIHHSVLLEDSDVSSIDSFSIAHSGRASPNQQEKSIIGLEETSSISSTSTFDSANIPYIDTSDDASKHPIAPPRKHRRQKNTTEVGDRLIGRKNKPADRLIGQKNPPPKPAPRKSLSKDIPHTEITSVPLIELDSPEYVDVFDPFSSGNSSTVGRVEEIRELFSSPENSPGKQGSTDIKFHELSRTHAFRKQALDTPKRDFCKADISPSPERDLMSNSSPSDLPNKTNDKATELFASFDPLISEKCNLSGSQKSETQGNDLIQNWNINHLKTGSRVKSSSQFLAGGNNDPRCRDPVGVTNNPIYGTKPLRQNKPVLPPRPKTVVGSSVLSSQFKPVVVDNPFYSVDNSSSNSAKVQSRNSDPFSDLHEISVSNRKSQEFAQSKWEKF